MCIVLSPNEKTFASISDFMHICDSEKGHCILGPFQLNLESPFFAHTNACFSPDGKHVLVRCRLYNSLICRAVVWDIERGEVFQIEGFNSVFIHCGHNEGRIASMDWIIQDEPVSQTVALKDKNEFLTRTIVSKNRRPTRILVKLWDVGNSIFERLFEVTGVTVAQFSPNGQYLAVGRQFESVIELWSLDDGKIAHQFPHPPGRLSSLHFSPTSDCLVAVFRRSRHKCLWRLDTQQMVSFDLDATPIGPAVIHLPHTNHVFVPRGHTVKIWEVSTTGSNMIFKIESPTTSSICPSRNGHRLLIGSMDGNVRMWNLEDLGSNQPVTQDDADQQRIIGFSPSGNMAATVALGSTHVELRDTATWELVGPRYIERAFRGVFSTDDNWIAVLSESLVTIWDINHPENRLSFDPCPKGKSVLVREAAFRTRDDLVICAMLNDDDSKEISGLL